MEWQVKDKSYHFDKDFRELSASKRIKVVKMVRNLLKIQKEDKALLAGFTLTDEGVENGNA